MLRAHETIGGRIDGLLFGAERLIIEARAELPSLPRDRVAAEAALDRATEELETVRRLATR